LDKYELDLELRHHRYGQGSGSNPDIQTTQNNGRIERDYQKAVCSHRLYDLVYGNRATPGAEAGTWHCQWYRGSTRGQEIRRVQRLDETAWNSTFDHSSCDGEAIAATAWCSEQFEGTVESADGEQQVEGEVESMVSAG
jgi:hypothetical protein